MPRARHALAGLCAAILTLATAGAPARAEEPATSPIHLKVLYTRYLSFAPLAIAQAEGFFRAQGLEVELVSLTGSLEATPLLIRGELDVVPGMVKIGDFNAISRGAALRLVADKGHFEPGPCVPAAFVTRPEFIDAKSPEGSDPLKGARVALAPLSFIEYAFETLLGRRGLALSDLKLARLREGTTPEAIARGSLDVAQLAEPELSRAVRSGRAVIWKSMQEIVPGGQLATVSFGPGLVEKNREAGRRFMVGYLQGVRQYNQGKTARNLELVASATGLDPDLLARTCWQPIRGDGKINVESLLDFQRWAVRRGVLSAVVPPERFWDPFFTDEANKALGSPASSAP